MKIRNGFVSNSSSSSFLIYGVSVDMSEILDYAVKQMWSRNEYGSLRLDPNGTLTGEEVREELEDEGDNYEILSGLLKGTILSQEGSGDMGYYVGRSWSSVGDDETGGQFKASVREALNKIGLDGTQASTLEEAWHD